MKDAAIIARARIPEARALALLRAHLDAHPDNHTRSGPLSPGLRAELARRISAAVPEARALLSAADALLWQVVASYEGILRRRAERWSQMTGHVAADPEDLAAAARYGCWRGLLRWQPGSGAAPLHWALQWAESAAQRDDSSGGDLVGGLSTQHRSRGWDRPRATLATARLDAPAPYGDGRILLHSLIPAPVVGDDLDTRLDLHQIRGRIEQAVAALPARAQAIIRARLEGEILSDIGARLGLSRERARQVEVEAIDAIRSSLSSGTLLPAADPRRYTRAARRPQTTPPAPDTVSGRVCALLQTDPAMTASTVAAQIGITPSSASAIAGKMRKIGAAPPKPEPPAPPPMPPGETRAPLSTRLPALVRAYPGLRISGAADALGSTVETIRSVAHDLRVAGVLLPYDPAHPGLYAAPIRIVSIPTLRP